MQFKLASLLFCLALAATICAAQTDDWVKVAPLGGGFSVAMPEKPKEETKASDEFTLHLFSVTTSNAIFQVGYSDYALSIHLDPAVDLIANRDKFLQDVNARLMESKDIKLNGRAGIEFTGQSEQAFFKSRFYIFGNRIHQISVAVMNGRLDDEYVNRYFASFALDNP